MSRQETGSHPPGGAAASCRPVRKTSCLGTNGHAGQGNTIGGRDKEDRKGFHRMAFCSGYPRKQPGRAWTAAWKRYIVILLRNRHENAEHAAQTEAVCFPRQGGKYDRRLQRNCKMVERRLSLRIRRSFLEFTFQSMCCPGLFKKSVVGLYTIPEYCDVTSARGASTPPASAEILSIPA